MSDESPYFFGDNDEYSNKEENGSTESLNNQNANTDDSGNIFNTSEYDLNYFSTKNPTEFVSDIHKPKSTKKTNKKNIGKDKNKKRSKKAMVGKVILTTFLVFIITGCLVMGAFAVYVLGFIDDTMQDNLDSLTLDFTTTVYVQDSNTGEFVEYQRLHGNANRIWVGFDKMPENLKKAFVAIEDKRFYTHNGVDWKRTFSAFANMFFHLYSSNQGGSTITQQLVKNLTGDKDRTPMRKIREIMRARYLEDNYHKDTILECYLNVIPLAHGIEGVEVASNYYFNKSVGDLSLVECASIAAITKDPEKYRPDLYPDKNKERRDTILDEMYSQEYISEEECNAAKAEVLNVIATDETVNEVEINSYFIDTLIDNVVEGLVEQYNFDKSYASTNFYNGGYKIYCTLDPKVQSTMEKVYTNAKYFKQKSDKDKTITPESAMTVMDYTGHILGIIGGKGEKIANRSLNRAWSSPRQPGSTMKPLGAYSLALDNNLITYSTLFDDTFYNKDKNGKSWPKNWYGKYGGKTTVQLALERSVNTIPVHIVSKLGIEKSYKYLTEKLGIKHLIGDYDHDLNLSSLALGGCSYGITTTESAAAFATFGNLGSFYAPSTYYKVTDQYDNLVLQQAEPIVAVSEDTANIMNRLLQTVVTGGRGTGIGAKGSCGSLPIFAKTGTSSESNDLWFVGGTPYYIGSCWYGFDTPEKLDKGTYAQTIWKDIMSELNKGLEVKDFPQSEYVTERWYCQSTGLLANTGCSSIAKGWFKSSYLPPCTTHGGKARPEVVAKSSTTSTTSTASTTSTTSTATETPATPSVEVAVSQPVTTSTAETSSTVTSSASTSSQQTSTSSQSNTTAGGG
ncbi:MAG: transglycosylase domain-containing protein [Oscillospiraceae bacterium]|nr:transglycosylase domain-containing protein [Oscillospiraceae bacterium]